MERLRNSVKRYYWGRLIRYFLTCWLILSTSLQVVMAAPTGGVVDLTDPRNGNATIFENAGFDELTTLVDVATQRTIINWAGLDTAGGDPGVRETLAFTQTLADSAVLNRVSGGMTYFNGDLTAPGMRIFMVNPAGIIFGGGPTGARVNVSQLVASGLNMSNDAFHAVLDDVSNEMVFEGGYGEVKNYGLIEATDSVHLIGRKAWNTGTIRANEGSKLIVMAAGEKVYIAQDGSNVRVELLVEPADVDPDVRNASNLQAHNGTIVLAAGDTFSGAISRAILNVGIIEASGGTVTARAGQVNNNGKIIVSGSENGGTVNLAGSESVSIGLDGSEVAGSIEANAGTEGNGGSVTIETDDLFEMGADSLITARGGSVSGNGGHVKITSETFVIAGDIDASPASTDFEPGTLMIDSSSVTIANGLNPADDGDIPATPAENTLYEVDIENLSDKGTSVVVNADDKITVKDIADGTIKGGFGNIELYATGPFSSVTFDDNTNTIRTTLGDIAIGAGSEGINIGNLITGDAELGATPGRIILGTTQAGDLDPGDITTGDLIIEGGSGHAEINVDSAGELTVNGDVIVGTSAIDNMEGSDAEAMIYLKAGDHANINQEVSAFADATNPGDSTAYIEISAGTNDMVEGDAFINGNVLADAKASEGTAEAIVKIEAWSKVLFADGVEVHATADDEAAKATEATNYEDDEDPDPYESGDHAQIIIKAENKTLTGLPDFFLDNHMGSLVEGNVLTNDLGPTDKAELVTDPSHAESFTLNEDGTFSYTPKAGYVGDDTFTYRVTSEVEEPTGPVLVTITMTNDLPVVTDEAEVIHMGDLLSSNVLTNDTDINEDQLKVVLDGTAPEHGTVTLNANGTYTYKPDDGYVGEDSFKYEVADGQLDELGNPVVVVGTATITISNNLPTPKDDTATTRTSVPVSGNVLKNDTDPDNDSLKVVLNGTEPEHGTLKLNADGSFTYTSDDDFVGEDKFTYILTDGAIDAEPIIGTVIITVDEMPIFIPPAPLPEKIEFEISGCPALAKWVAEELGVDERMIDIWIVNTLASSRNINPVDTYTRLKAAAIVLQDSDGVYIGALTQVVNEFASSFTPPTEEQMASIAEAITRNGDDDSHYALAGKYLRALADYIGILNYEMGFSPMESVQFVTDKYINRLTGDENVGVAAFLAASASALAG